MTELLGIPVNVLLQGGAVGMLGLTVLMIFTGRLVPLRNYRSLEEDRDHWRDVAIKSIGQADELLLSARIAANVADALHKEAKS